MAKRGRQPKLEREVVLDKLSDHVQILFHNDNIKPSADPIYKVLGTKLNLTPKAMYLAVKRNTQKLWEILQTQSGEKELSTDGVKYYNSESETDYKDTDSIKSINSTDSAENNRELLFNINVAGIFKFEQCKIKRSDHRSEVRERLQKGWSSRFCELIWTATKIRCTWSFKSVWKRSEVCLLKGACSECGAEFHGTLQNDQMRVLIKKYRRSYNHKTTRQLTGAERESAYQGLSGKSALAVRSEIVNKTMTAGDELAPIVPSLAVLRQAKYKKSIADLPNIDPVKSITNWKNSILKNTISFVGSNPFFVFYTTPVQREWYRLESKQHRMAISIDATGSLVIPPKDSEISSRTGQLKHVFLYNIVAKVPNRKSVPVHQMLSQKHTASFIAYWLSVWRDSVASAGVPLEVTCDESKALQLAVVKTFTSCSNMSDYIDKCTISLMTNSDPPECYIRNDRSHVIKIMSRKLKETDKRKEKLSRSVFGFLIQCDNFDVAREIITDFFTIVLNEYDGCNSNNMPLPAEVSRNRLTTLCSTHEIDDYDKEYNDETILDQIDEEESPIKEWLMMIVDNISVVQENTEFKYHDNLFYNPQKKKKIYS